MIIRPYHVQQPSIRIAQMQFHITQFFILYDTFHIDDAIRRIRIYIEVEAVVVVQADGDGKVQGDDGVTTVDGLEGLSVVA